MRNLTVQQHVWLNERPKITILFVWVLCAHDGAPAKHHLVLCESAGLV